MKAEEFWNILCSEFSYKFFAGVPCMGLKPLYDKMSAKFMHYVPAVKENVALGLVSGARLSGIKGAVLMDSTRIHNIMDWLISFNIKQNVPILIIMFENNQDVCNILKSYKIPYRNLTSAKDIKFLAQKIEKVSIPAVCLIREGVIE